MKYKLLALVLALVLLSGCAAPVAVSQGPVIAATTYPVYQFAAAVAAGTPLQVRRVITEAVSCVHDYTLTVGQMKILERCDAAVISGLGLEEFLEDVLPQGRVLDASSGAELICTADDHHHEEKPGHHHDHDHGAYDPHLWLDPDNAAAMTRTICDGLTGLYPQYANVFRENADAYCQKLSDLKAYGLAQLEDLSCRELVTFHDGFAYFAQTFDLHILAAMEVEAGSEPSAKELEEIVHLVQDHRLPALFTEVSGSSSAADIVAAETGAQVLALDMGMGQADYFAAMQHNIETIKEALE